MVGLKLLDGDDNIRMIARLMDCHTNILSRARSENVDCHLGAFTSLGFCLLNDSAICRRVRTKRLMRVTSISAFVVLGCSLS
jgi:hypothetical protein